MKSGKINTDVILDACRRCFPVDLWTQHKIGTLKYAGTLLATESTGNTPAVRASIQLPDRETESPVRGTEVRAFFLNAGGIYSFKTTVLDWNPYKDAKDRGIVTLAFPDQVKIAQRRSFFRVPYPLNNRSNIEVSVTFRDEKHLVKGMIKDLSGGGIAVRCVKSPMNFFEIGTSDTVNWKFLMIKKSFNKHFIRCNLTLLGKKTFVHPFKGWIVLLFQNK